MTFFRSPFFHTTRIQRLPMTQTRQSVLPTVVALLAALVAPGCFESSDDGERASATPNDPGVEDDGASVDESETESESGTDATEPESEGNDPPPVVACEVTSTLAGCDACLANFCEADCIECSGTDDTECDLSYSCVADQCADAEEETDLECVIDCASVDDPSARALYALIDCGKLNCPGYCHF
jgi:hypothetical protein